MVSGGATSAEIESIYRGRLRAFASSRSRTRRLRASRTLTAVATVRQALDYGRSLGVEQGEIAAVGDSEGDNELLTAGGLRFFVGPKRRTFRAYCTGPMRTC